MAKHLSSLFRQLYKRVFPHWIKNALQLSLNNIERYQSATIIDLPPGKRILVLAPHPDDECIGCGGTVAKCLAAGLEVRVIVLTDGRQGNVHIRSMVDGNPEKTALQQKLIARRRTETRTAMKLLGLEQVLFLEAEDSQLTANTESISKKLAQELDTWQADTVLLPFLTDRHADHFATSRCLIQACTQLDPGYTNKLQCMGYEAWSPLYANVLVDISASIEIKLAAIQCYQSQLEELDYGSAIEGLNRYRALTGMTGGSHAEAFYLCALPEYQRLYQQLLL